MGVYDCIAHPTAVSLPGECVVHALEVTLTVPCEAVIVWEVSLQLVLKNAFVIAGLLSAVNFNTTWLLSCSSRLWAPRIPSSCRLFHSFFPFAR